LAGGNLELIGLSLELNTTQLFLFSSVSEHGGLLQKVIFQPRLNWPSGKDRVLKVRGHRGRRFSDDCLLPLNGQSRSLRRRISLPAPLWRRSTP
jgi:hypothetical protein